MTQGVPSRHRLGCRTLIRRLFSRHPSLSPEQLRNSATWQRLDGGQLFVASSPLEPQDILQHIVTDCSVCGSIAVCICHNRRFQTEVCIGSNVLAQGFSLRWRLQLGRSNLHVAQGGQSAQGPSSIIYHVRLLFNGAYRRVGTLLLFLMILRSLTIDMCASSLFMVPYKTLTNELSAVSVKS